MPAAKPRRVVITAELIHTNGPRRYDEDDALTLIESEMDGLEIYPNSANGEDETGLKISVLRVEWEGGPDNASH